MEILISKTDKINPYKHDGEEAYTVLNRKTRKRETKYRKRKAYFCKIGDELEVISDRNGVHIVKNKDGDRFSLRSEFVEKKL